MPSFLYLREGQKSIDKTVYIVYICIYTEYKQFIINPEKGMKIMITLNGVSKRLGKFQLKNITFDLPCGYICGLVGQNGAGKTTLLHLLLGLYRQEEGTLTIDGMDFEQDEKKLHDRIGTVLVEELFDSSYSIRDNADRYGVYFSKYRWEKMNAYLEQFKLDPRRKFGKLSKGEKLKCQFAFALSYEPELLILDEPTGNFDPEFREQFFRIIQEYIADGTRTVILATHLTDDLDRITDYLIYLENGEQIFAGDIESFRAEYRIVSGEKYKINLLPKERIVHMEEKKYGAKALVVHSKYNKYEELTVTHPTIEEFMYFYSKRAVEL